MYYGKWLLLKYLYVFTQYKNLKYLYNFKSGFLLVRPVHAKYNKCKWYELNNVFTNNIVNVINWYFYKFVQTKPTFEIPHASAHHWLIYKLYHSFLECNDSESVFCCGCSLRTYHYSRPVGCIAWNHVEETRRVSCAI